jgi:hypothetical protein
LDNQVPWWIPIQCFNWSTTIEEWWLVLYQNSAALNQSAHFDGQAWTKQRK